jgi:hypothetical protein
MSAGKRMVPGSSSTNFPPGKEGSRQRLPGNLAALIRLLESDHGGRRFHYTIVIMLDFLESPLAIIQC